MKTSGFCVVLALSLGWLGSGENWPRFRGPDGQGHSSETGLPIHWSQTSNIIWKAPIPGSGWSSPIVQDDRVFLTTTKEEGSAFHLLCLDRRDGRVQWDRHVLTQTLLRREGRNSYATATPTTDGRRVFALSFNGTLIALDMAGHSLWTNSDYQYYSQHGLAVSPILHEDLVIVAFDPSSQGDDKSLGWKKPWDQATLQAVDRQTGTTRWRGARTASRIGHATPVVWSEGGAAQLISSAGDVIQGFDLKTGKRLWSVYSQGEGVVPSPVVGAGLVFTCSGFEKPTIRAARLGGSGDVTKTHIAWEQTKGVPAVPSLIYVNPWVFSVSDGGVAMCLSADTGQVLWQERLGGNYSASPVCVERRLYFLSDEGATTIVEAKPEFKVVAVNPLREKCQASIAVSQGCLFLRTERNLYCIGETARR